MSSRVRSFRLLAYTDAPGLGGAELSLANLVEALDPAIDVTVLGSSAAVVGEVAGRRPAAASHVAPVWQHPALLARLRPDVVHGNLPVPWGGALGLAAALALPGTRVLAVQQLPLRTVDLAVWLRTRALLRRLDAHVAVGEASARRIEDFYALGRGSVRSIPNFVPDLGPPPAPPADRPYTIGSIGRLDPAKGYDVLLHALARLPDARLVLVGDGAQRDQLAKQAASLGVLDRVELRGWDPQPRRLLADFDVFCLPSRSEGFPLSVVEAMLAGLPVVATRVGSVAEAVAHEVTGLLVEPNDVDGLASVLDRLRGRTLRGQYGRAARQRAAAEFTVDRMARAYERLYEELLTQPRTPRLRPPPPQP